MHFSLPARDRCPTTAQLPKILFFVSTSNSSMTSPLVIPAFLRVHSNRHVLNQTVAVLTRLVQMEGAAPTMAAQVSDRCVPFHSLAPAPLRVHPSIPPPIPPSSPPANPPFPPSPQLGLDLQGNTFWEFRDLRHGPSSAAARWRRIVHPGATSAIPSGRGHYADLRLSPAWHQWLRHARADPPTLPEQRADVARIERVGRLAREAEQRWKLGGAGTGAAQALPPAAAAGGTQQQQQEARTGAGGERESATRHAGGEEENKEAAAAAQASVARTMACAGGVAPPVTATRAEAASEPEEAAVDAEEAARDDGQTRPADTRQAKVDPWKAAKAAAREKWQPEAWKPPVKTPR